MIDVSKDTALPRLETIQPAVNRLLAPKVAIGVGEGASATCLYGTVAELREWLGNVGLKVAAVEEELTDDIPRPRRDDRSVVERDFFV